MKGLSRALMEKIKAAIADIDNWRDKDTTQAAVRNLIHDTPNFVGLLNQCLLPQVFYAP